MQARVAVSRKGNLMLLLNCLTRFYSGVRNGSDLISIRPILSIIMLSNLSGLTQLPVLKLSSRARIKKQGTEAVERNSIEQQ